MGEVRCDIKSDVAFNPNGDIYGLVSVSTALVRGSRRLRVPVPGAAEFLTVKMSACWNVMDLRFQ